MMTDRDLLEIVHEMILAGTPRHIVEKVKDMGNELMELEAKQPATQPATADTGNEHTEETRT